MLRYMFFNRRLLWRGALLITVASAAIGFIVYGTADIGFGTFFAALVSLFLSLSWINGYIFGKTILLGGGELKPHQWFLRTFILFLAIFFWMFAMLALFGK